MNKYRIVKRKHYAEGQDKFFDWYDLEQEAQDYRVIQGWIMKKNRWYHITSEKSIEEVMQWVESKTKRLKAYAVEREREVIDTFELEVDFLEDSRNNRRRCYYG